MVCAFILRLFKNILLYVWRRGEEIMMVLAIATHWFKLEHYSKYHLGLTAKSKGKKTSLL